MGYDSLHDAIWDPNTTLKDIQDILRRIPGSVEEVDKAKRPYNYKNGKNGLFHQFTALPSRCLPLHASLERGRYEIAQVLLHEYPQATTIAINKGRLPLHLLFYDINRLPPIILVNDLIKANPNALTIAVGNKSLPFHTALRWAKQMLSIDREQTIRVVRIVFDAYPEAAKIPMHNSWSAIHLAVQSGDIDLVSMLTNRFPEILEYPLNVQGVWVPLFWASRNGYLNIVKLFLEKGGNESLTTLNSKGELPVHAVAHSQLTENHVEIAKLLVQQAPETILVATNDGKLPIHEIVTNRTDTDSGARLAITQLLIENGPLCMMRTPAQKGYKKRDLPIHLTADKGRSDLVPLLIKAAPDTLQITDGEGMLPIHRAAAAVGIDDTFMECLLIMAEAAPNTLGVSSPCKRRECDGLPLFIACKRQKFRDVKNPLQKRCFDLFLSHSPLDGKGSGEGSILHVALRHKLPLPFMRELIKFLSRNPNQLETLLRTQHDRMGQTPFHYRGPLDCFEEVINASPPELIRDVLQKKDTMSWLGNTPLHSTLDNSDRKRIAGRIQLLVDSCKESLLIRNAENLLPIQLAAKNEVPREIVHYLAVNAQVFDVDALVVVCEYVQNLSTCYEYLNKFSDIFETILKCQER